MKQLIFASRKKGFAVCGASDGMKGGEQLFAKLYASYYAPPACCSAFENDPSDPDRFFPIRRKYFKLAQLDGQGYCLARENYLGYEYFFHGRLGNKFMHALTFAEPPETRPAEYLIGDFLRRELTESEIESNVKATLDEITALPPEIAAEEYFPILADEDTAEKFTALFELIAYALDGDNRHVIIYNARECGDLLWKFIVMASELLPIEKAREFTFDTHCHLDFKRVDLPAAPQQLRASFENAFMLSEKLIAFYDDYEKCSAWENRNKSHEYIFVDGRSFAVTAAPAATESLREVTKAAASFTTAELDCYRKACDGSGDGYISAMTGAAALIARIAQFGKVPRETVVRAFSALAEGSSDKDCAAALAEIMYAYRENPLTVVEATGAYACGSAAAKQAVALLLVGEYGEEFIDGYSSGKPDCVELYDRFSALTGDETAELMSDAALRFAEKNAATLADGVMRGDGAACEKVAALLRLNPLDGFCAELKSRYEKYLTDEKLSALISGDGGETAIYSAVAKITPSIAEKLNARISAAYSAALDKACAPHNTNKAKDVCAVAEKFAGFLSAEQIDASLVIATEKLCAEPDFTDGLADGDENSLRFARYVRAYPDSAAALGSALTGHAAKKILSDERGIAALDELAGSACAEFFDMGDAVAEAAREYASAPENEEITRTLCKLRDRGYSDGFTPPTLERMLRREIADLGGYCVAQLDELDKKYAALPDWQRWECYAAVSESEQAKAQLGEYLRGKDATALLNATDALVKKTEIAAFIVDTGLAERFTDRAITALLVSDKKYAVLARRQRERIWSSLYSGGIFSVNDISRSIADILPRLDAQTQDYIVGEFLERYSLVGLKPKNLDAVLSACSEKNDGSDIAFLRFYSAACKARTEDLPKLRVKNLINRYCRIIVDGLAFGEIHYAYAAELYNRFGGNFAGLFAARYGKYAKRRAVMQAWDALCADERTRNILVNHKSVDLGSYVRNHCYDDTDSLVAACRADADGVNDDIVNAVLKNARLSEVDASQIEGAVKLLSDGKSEYLAVCGGFNVPDGARLKSENLLRYLAHLMSKKKIPESKLAKIVASADRSLIYYYLESLTDGDKFSAKLGSISKYYDIVFAANKAAAQKLRDSVELLVRSGNDVKSKIKADKLICFIDNKNN